MRAAVVVVIIVAAVACGSFRDGVDPTPASDGGVPDAPPPTIDAGGAGCGWPLFTDEFERETAVSGGWELYTSGSGGIVLGTGKAPDARGLSLAIDIRTVTAGEGRQNALALPLAARAPSPSPACFELAFSIFVERFAGNDSAVASIELDDDTVVSVWISNDSFFAVEQTTDGSTFETAGETVLTLGSWHGARLRYTPGATQPIELAYDGAIVVTPPRSVVTNGKPVSIRLGAGFTRPDTSAKFWIDDVVIH